MGYLPGVIMGHMSDTAFLLEQKTHITIFMSTHFCKEDTSLNFQLSAY